MKLDIVVKKLLKIIEYYIKKILLRNFHAIYSESEVCLKITKSATSLILIIQTVA